MNSYVGNLKIHEVNKNGYFIRILNVSHVVEEEIGNYTIQQMVSAMPVTVFRFPSSTKLPPGHTVTVWSKTDQVEHQPPHTFVWSEQDKWATGSECTTILAKPNGQAVSWTTGCHKFGNIEYDEIVPVLSCKRNKEANIQLNRQKLTQHAVFSSTKHPHGSTAIKIQQTDSNNEIDKLHNEIGAKNINNNSLFFNLQKPRPVNSAQASRRESKSNNIANSSSTAANCTQPASDNDLVYQKFYQENFSFLNRD